MKLQRKNMLEASRPKAKAVTKALAPAYQAGLDSKGPDDYQAQSDAEALARAHGIRADKKRHEAALKHMASKANAHHDALMAENVLKGESKKNADPKAKGKVYYATSGE